MAEKLVKYSRTAVGDYDGVVQTRSWDCGPASAQIILHAAGVNKSEQWLIDQIGTTVEGTNSAECIIPVLNSLLPGSGYKVVWLSREPVTKAQVDQLWANITRSIDADRGVILNFEAPPGRGPKGTRGSVSPNYSTTRTIFHYTAGMGYVVDDDGSRHIWVADPGFPPITGYWCALEDVARLIVPHAYAYAATAPTKPADVVITPQSPATNRLDVMWTEWNAIEFGDPDAIASIVRSAQAGDMRAARALAKLEQTNPAALQAFINRKAA